MVFHSRAVKLLILEKRVRPDLLLTISFLSSCVLASTHHDWEKLNRLLFLHTGTIRLISIVASGDVLYAAQASGHGQSNRMIQAGIRGGITIVEAGSSKQDTIVRISTRSELISGSDTMDVGLRSNHALGVQGHVATLMLLKDDPCTYYEERNDKTSEIASHLNSIAMDVTVFQGRASRGIVLPHRSH